MALSEADKQYLNADQQKQIAALKDAWAAASAAGDQAGMESANKQAEAIRAQAGYSGGADGSGYTLLSGQNGGQAQNSQFQNAGQGQNTYAGDQSLSADLQAQIAALQEEYAKAQAEGNQIGMQNAHAQAEAIRNRFGYSGGADGSQANRIGGLPADYVQQWVDDYRKSNYNEQSGWNNGYSVDMNLRSMANFIRQQMQANSEAWATADAQTRQYLHDQNQKLAQILEQNNGGAKSVYNEALGRWETSNANLGYGFNTGQYNDPDWYKNFYGMTDDQIKQYQNDTDRYRNFVDQRVVRNWVDDSNGYTGIYSQFVNGPFGQLAAQGTNNVNPWIYTDVIGDGFNDEADSYRPVVDANGNIVPQAPKLKNANDMSPYSKQFASFVDENGVIQPGVRKASNGAYSGSGTVNPYRYDPADQQAYTGADYSNVKGDPRIQAVEKLTGVSTGLSGGTGGTGSGGLQDYINQIYDASLKSQLAQLEAAYQESLAELEKSQTETDAAYNEQKRQTQGDAERNAANWRELAMAQGLNTGAMGQAALSQHNQLQSNLNTLSAAQQKALDNIRNQRALLGKQYQLQILQAQADNDFERAQMLYSEAVRQDEILREQEKEALSMMQSLLSKVDGISYGGMGYQGALAAAGLGGSGSGGSGSGGSVSGGTGRTGYGTGYKALYADAYASENPENYIASNYPKYGLTHSSGLKDGYKKWLSDQQMNDAEFAMFQNTLQQLARASQVDRVFSQIENNMVRLSPDQQDQVEEFLNRWGRG